jgi:hypothetical protein
MSLGASALLGTVENRLRIVSRRGSKQCRTRRVARLTRTPKNVLLMTYALSACESAVRAPRETRHAQNCHQANGRDREHRAAPRSMASGGPAAYNRRMEQPNNALPDDKDF